MPISGSLKITGLVFKAGVTPGSRDPLKVDVSPVLVIVGPNNSGKSLALQEIENWCFNVDEARRVVSEIKVDFPTDLETAKKLMMRFKTSPIASEILREGDFRISQYRFRGSQPVSNVTNEIVLRNTLGNEHEKRNYFTSWYTIRLDGRTRFNLVSDQPSGDLLAPPANHLVALFLDDEARKKVRTLTYEAFKLYFVLDPTGMQNLKIRMSDRKPEEGEEQGLDRKAREFQGSAKHIDQFSDGVQAFVGLTSAILSLDHKIILIDEPEAFLFPPLAKRLGANLAAITNERGATLIVATHSSEFLVGCLEKTDVSVVRLTYQNGVATARKADASQLREMMRDPLLRSARVLDSLFHRSVAVAEGDTDRAFYDEINRRLQVVQRGFENALFLNAQNKQTEHKIVAPLRRLGIPAAAVVDLDFLEDSGPNWNNLLSAALIPVSVISELDVERRAIAEAFSRIPFQAHDMRPIKKEGISALQGEEHVRCNLFLSRLAEFGIFPVPCGQVENWLQPLGVIGHGSGWLVEVFARLGNDDASPNYVQAGNGDVWDFLDRIGLWVNDANRKGTDIQS
jgi:ABC-type polar amino acid transport system ATPase subunit